VDKNDYFVDTGYLFVDSPVFRVDKKMYIDLHEIKPFKLLSYANQGLKSLKIRLSKTV
jgi:hypothetical protein